MKILEIYITAQKNEKKRGYEQKIKQAFLNKREYPLRNLLKLLFYDEITYCTRRCLWIMKRGSNFL